MSALARPARLLSRTMLSSVHTSRHATPLLAMRVQRRTYAAKKGKGAQSANAFVPGSQLVSADPAAIAEHARCGERMAAAVAWYRKEVAGAEARAAGRVTPALLAPVRVVLPGGGEPVRLDEVATVGVREGTTLLITVFEEANLKHVETGIYSAKVPGVTPQKLDNRTIKIPIPKPTVESRLALYGTAQKQAEEVRVQLRKHHQASVKKGGYKKFSIELDSFQKLLNDSIADVDQVLAAMKKTTGAK